MTVFFTTVKHFNIKPSKQISEHLAVRTIVQLSLFG